METEGEHNGLALIADTEEVEKDTGGQQLEAEKVLLKLKREK